MRVITVLLVGILALMVALREARLNRHKVREYNLKMAKYISESATNVVTMPRIELLKPTCMSKEFNYTVARRKCTSKVIANKFCYGLCGSWYVPGEKVNEMFSR